jgi:hypothetical protein
MADRKSMGNPKDGVMIPVAPSLAELPDSYAELRDTVIGKIRESRVRMVLQVQEGMIQHYWDLGNEILLRQKTEGWGAKVIDRLSKDIKEAVPDSTGYSAKFEIYEKIGRALA